MKKVAFTALISVSLLFLFLFWGGSLLTENSIANKVDRLKEISNTSPTVIFNKKTVANLPRPLKKYFTMVTSDSFKVPKFVTVIQKAEIKTSTKSQWLPVNAVEYFTTYYPNYLWDAELHTNKYFWVKTIDSYVEGAGNMIIKFNSSITISDAKSIEINKSDLFRYFSEAVVFPTSMLPNDSLKWNMLDSNIAEIKYKHKSVSIVAKVFFNENGLIEKILTNDKFRSTEKGYVQTPYTVYYSNYKWFDNKYIVPSHYELEWDLPDGKFRYAKFDIQKVIYE